MRCRGGEQKRGGRAAPHRRIATRIIQRGKFPVVGFVKGPGGIAALYLGKRVGKELTSVGKVGTGFSRAVSADLRRKLDGVVTPKTKLSGKVSKPKATWVDPKLVAEVENRDITRGISATLIVQGVGEGVAAPTGKFDASLRVLRRRPQQGFQRPLRRPGRDEGPCPLKGALG